MDIQKYEQLRKDYINLQQELEQKSQALYDSERQKKTAEALLAECQEDLKILQNEDSTETTKLRKKIQELEETNLNQKTTYFKRTDYLEKDICNKENEITNLREKLEDLIKLSSSDESIIGENIFRGLELMKEEHDKVLHEKNNLLEELKKNLAFKEINQQLEADLTNYKEILSLKSVQLEEANSVIQNLKDDLLCAQSELESVRNKPLDPKTKGNSMFAGVDDRGVELQQEMNMMKFECNQMRQQRVSHLKQISSLRNENALILARWKEAVEEVKHDEDMELQSYKNQVRTLTDLMSSYQKQLKEKSGQFVAGASIQTKLFDNMIAAKNQEIESLRQTLSSKSLSETLLSKDLADLRKEIRKNKVEANKLQSDVENLKYEIEQIKLLKDVEVAEEEDVTETKVTYRKKVKRAIRILENKPIEGASNKIRKPNN